jgi:hypothetical protein
MVRYDMRPKLLEEPPNGQQHHTASPRRITTWSLYSRFLLFSSFPLRLSFS